MHAENVGRQLWPAIDEPLFIVSASQLRAGRASLLALVEHANEGRHRGCRGDVVDPALGRVPGRLGGKAWAGSLGRSTSLANATSGNLLGGHVGGCRGRAGFL